LNDDATAGADARATRRERIRRSPNFAGKGFRNPEPTEVMLPGGWRRALADRLRPRRARPATALPAVPCSGASFEAGAPGGVRACWLGHSTVLLEIERKWLLVDPVWAQRSSPSRFVGPARFQPSPLALDELPELAAVLISHDHYDHLDERAVRALARGRPALPFVVPLGVGAHLDRWGVAPAQIVELDWWEEHRLARDLRVEAAPARHFSGRGLLDRNATLWASYAIVGRGRRVFFGGDGGYHRGFAQIGRRLGPFDLTILEIGASHRSWPFVHLGPEGALRAHVDLRGGRLLPVHWGTFDLAAHDWDEPIEELVALAGGEPEGLLLPRLGEVVQLETATAPDPWWRASELKAAGTPR
jgi:L-ascorbate metabolism protein UlaG (beta-lactamase superfamily)